MKPQITVEVSTDAQVKVSVQGVSGKSCTDVTKAIEGALGKTVASEKTRDYYKQAGTGVKAKQ